MAEPWWLAGLGERADPCSPFFMAAPMYVFYETSIVIGRALKR